MTSPASCPRCSGPLRAPGLWSSDWQCQRHGAVHPYHLHKGASAEILEQVAAKAAVPAWIPAPLLPGWTVTGVGYAGDDRTGARATAVALSGPSPVGGPADAIVIAEEPGVGLGGRYAGLGLLDPQLNPSTAPEGKVEAAGHPTPMWRTQSADDRVAFAGEAKGLWLWWVLWPPQAELLLLEHVRLHDLREKMPPDLVFGAPSSYLAAPPSVIA